MGKRNTSQRSNNGKIFEHYVGCDLIGLGSSTVRMNDYRGTLESKLFD